MTKVDVLFPPGFIGVDYENVPGWSTHVIETKLATPITEDGETIDTEVSQIVWTLDRPAREGRQRPVHQLPAVARDPRRRGRQGARIPHRPDLQQRPGGPLDRPVADGRTPLSEDQRDGQGRRGAGSGRRRGGPASGCDADRARRPARRGRQLEQAVGGASKGARDRGARSSASSVCCRRPWRCWCVRRSRAGAGVGAGLRRRSGSSARLGLDEHRGARRHPPARFVGRRARAPATSAGPAPCRAAVRVPADRHHRGDRRRGRACWWPTGSSSKQQLPGGDKSVHNASFDGSLLQPTRQAPALASLHNYHGQPVNLASYRGKAVFVTFLYTHCPDVCPLIASQLHNALSRLGSKAGQVQLVAVSVDPRGDTSANVARFLKEHQLTGQMQYLIGSAAELGAGVAGVGGGLREGRRQPRIHQPLRARVRDQRERQAHRPSTPPT